MIALEIRTLDLRYAGLRIAEPVRRARLEAAIARQGQQAPVLVVVEPAGGHVLIDGYARVEALRRLGRDIVQAVLLDVSETEALVLRHRLETAARRTALEEGWLVRTLIDRGKSAADVALELAKSESWVSRRLALVRTLPEVAQEAVRAGRIGAHAAEKFLVPLARANADQCATLVEKLRPIRPTVRQLGRLYVAWKGADDAVRQQIVLHPMLYLKAEEEIREPTENIEALRDIEAISAACGRARKGLRTGTLAQLAAHRRPQITAAWEEAQLAFEALSGLLVEEGVVAAP